MSRIDGSKKVGITSPLHFCKNLQMEIIYAKARTLQGVVSTSDSHLQFERTILIYILLVFRLRQKVKKHNLVVASYDIVRNDSDFFK